MKLQLFLLTQLGKYIIKSRYSLRIILLCFWGALNLCCMVQLIHKQYIISCVYI